MAGFFLISGGQGGGGGANPNQNAFVQVRFEPATNSLIFTNANGNDVPVSLADIRPDIIQGVIKDIDIVNKELVIEDIDNQVTTIPLTKVLDAVDINFAPTPDIQSTDVQSAIVEVNNKVSNAYNDSSYNAQTGELTLTRHDGSTKTHTIGGVGSIVTINSEAPNAQGNIDLSLERDGDELQLKVNNDAKSRLNLYTDAEADVLIAKFI